MRSEDQSHRFTAMWESRISKESLYEMPGCVLYRRDPDGEPGTRSVYDQQRQSNEKRRDITMTVVERNEKDSPKVKAEEYLEQVSKKGKEIERLKEFREEMVKMIASPSGISYDNPIVQSSPSPDGVLNKVMKIGEYAKEIDALEAEYVEIKKRIQNEIFMMDKQLHIDILHMFYIEYIDIKEISEKLCYDYNYTCAKKTEALIAFAEKYL